VRLFEVRLRSGPAAGVGNTRPFLGITPGLFLRLENLLPDRLQCDREAPIFNVFIISIQALT
jgi:hypothetical protein